MCTLSQDTTYFLHIHLPCYQSNYIGFLTKIKHQSSLLEFRSFSPISVSSASTFWVFSLIKFLAAVFVKMSDLYREKLKLKSLRKRVLNGKGKYNFCTFWFERKTNLKLFNYSLSIIDFWKWKGKVFFHYSFEMQISLFFFC